MQYLFSYQPPIAPVPSNEQTRISRRENAMLDNYRACDEEDRKAIERIALSASSPKGGYKKIWLGLFFVGLLIDN